MFKFLTLFLPLILSCLPENSNLDRILSEPIHTVQFHQYRNGNTAINKIGIIPQLLLDTLKKWDNDSSYTPFIPDSNQINVFAKSISQLPPLNRKALEKRLLGIYFIKNFKSSGMTDFARDSSGVLFFYFVFDSRLFDETVRQRATMKENSCFIQKSRSIRIECGENISAVLFSLLHESTHAVDLVYQITPFPHRILSTLRMYPKFTSGFSQPIWDSFRNPKREYEFLGRDSLTFYGFNNGPKHRIEEAKGLYYYFQETPFASLYGSLNWAEDLAELVTFYHLTQIMGTNYKISLLMDGESYFDYEPMKNPKVKTRFKMISNFYKENPDPPPVVGVGMAGRLCNHHSDATIAKNRHE